MRRIKAQTLQPFTGNDLRMSEFISNGMLNNYNLSIGQSLCFDKFTIYIVEKIIHKSYRKLRI